LAKISSYDYRKLFILGQSLSIYEVKPNELLPTPFELTTDSPASRLAAGAKLDPLWTLFSVNCMLELRVDPELSTAPDWLYAEIAEIPAFAPLNPDREAGSTPGLSWLLLLLLNDPMASVVEEIALPMPAIDENSPVVFVPVAL
jgi:hypothetical protein